MLIGVIAEYFPIFSNQSYQVLENRNTLKDDKELVKSKNTLGKFFLAFSPSRNLKKMFYTPQRKNDYLSVFNGIRVISMYFVVLGHTQSGIAMSGPLNVLSIEGLYGSWWAIFFAIGYYAVDVFFFLSAFLASYLMISKFEGKKIINFGMIYLHRLIRIVPSIMMFTALMITFLELLGSGPVYLPTVENFLIDP